MLSRLRTRSARRVALWLGGIAAFVVASVLIGIYMLLLPGHASDRGAGSGGGPVTVREVHVDALLGANPAYAGLTPDQTLDKSGHEPWFRGMLRGRTGAATVHKLPLGVGNFADIVTDVTFTVEEFVGPGDPPCRIGSTIVLRLPGGSIGKDTVTYEDAPTVIGPKTDLYVALRDHGVFLGGDTNGAVIVSSDADVFEVRNGMVAGRGPFGGLNEPVAVFEQHFRR